jgi:mono/diheme cytochrome c family protein
MSRTFFAWRRLLLALLLLAATASAQAAEDDILAAGEALFESRCAGVCHQMPEAGQLTAKQWPVVLNTMQLRMKQFGLPPLDAAEYEAVLYYLKAQVQLP